MPVDLKFGIAFEVGGSKFGEVCRSASKSALFKAWEQLKSEIGPDTETVDGELQESQIRT